MRAGGSRGNGRMKAAAGAGLEPSSRARSARASPRAGDSIEVSSAVPLFGWPNASREAALAQAAHDVLVALYPNQRLQRSFARSFAVAISRCPKSHTC